MGTAGSCDEFISSSFVEISHAGINVEEMENVIFSDALAACAKIRLDEPPEQKVLDRIQKGSENVLAVSLLDVPA